MRRVIDTSNDAIEIFETFNDRKHAKRVPLPFSWPKEMQEIGEAKAQMYSSNKWKKNLEEFDNYKHVAEDYQRCFATPGFLRDWKSNSRLRTYGDMFELEDPLPKHIAILAPLIGLQVRLFDSRKKLPTGDKNLYEVTIPHAHLAGARHPDTGQTFLVVYTKRGGIHMLMLGDSLDIEKDGIVG